MVGDARSESGMTERESGMTEVACALNIPAGQWHTRNGDTFAVAAKVLIVN